MRFLFYDFSNEGEGVREDKSHPRCSGGEGATRVTSEVEASMSECTYQLFYKFIIDSLPLAVVTMDSKFRISGFNPCAEKLTGYSAEEAIGRDCREILRSNLCGEKCLLRAVRDPETQSLASRADIIGKDGKITPVRINAAALFDGRGYCIGGVEVIGDISTRVAMERQRTNFSSLLAHDLRSSLTGIHGLGLRLLRKPSEMDEEKARRILENIVREAGKLESLVDDFLELSRIEGKQVALNFTSVSLDKELEEIFEVYRERAEQRGLLLQLKVAEILPLIEADANRLRRVFTNLLDNALKFSREGGAIIIQAKETDHEIIVSVEDSGVGIEPLDLPFIFEIFHRGRTAGRRDGHGLGLATVKAIVEGHGGRIVVSSNVGVGSTFSVFLPKHYNSMGNEPN